MDIKQLICFTNDAAAIEKTLRLLQGLCQILATYALSAENSNLWALCRRQFALGRRYIRFFRWIDAFSKSWDAFLGIERLGDLEGWMAVGKWGFLGAYLGCESAGILDVMGIWPAKWAKMLLIEGNKFWFYSLLFSIALGILQLISLSSSPSSPSPTKTTSPDEKGEKEEKIAYEVEKKRKKKTGKLKRKLVADCLDLLVPGFVVGWIPISSALAGLATVGSSWIGLEDIWDGMG